MDILSLLHIYLPIHQMYAFLYISIAVYFVYDGRNQPFCLRDIKDKYR